MARPKAFEPSEALHQAIQLFWSKGYAATSMEDLVQAMGINRASMYNTFGNKHTLYMQALESYWQNVMQEPLRAFVESGNMLGALAQFQEVSGCFLLGCMSELSTQDPEVASFVERSFEHMRQQIAHGVAQERLAGHWSHVPHDEEAASLILTCLVGMRTLAKGSMAHLGHAGMQLLQKQFS